MAVNRLYASPTRLLAKAEKDNARAFDPSTI
jgi:hypothetical protein